VDRFGRYPLIMENLFKIALIRVLAREKYLQRVVVKQNQIILIGHKIRRELTGGLDQVISELEKLGR
ncbi:MAG: hypothetical protein OEZ20_10285, partial [candidate division WOR-3 bacterium]|nr:hypothetical protein [candidate division WOR-3 bacterium]